MLVTEDGVRCRVIKVNGVQVIFALPFLLDDPVHDPAIKDAVHIELIEIPEAVVALIVCLLDQYHHLIRIIVHL